MFNYGARKVPIYLVATQGMRDLEQRNQTASIDILEFVNTVMEEVTNAKQDQHDIFKLGHGPNDYQPNSPNVKYPDRTARIIEGHMEGLLAWVSINFDVKSKSPTTGIFELGGASMQVAFVAEGDNGNNLEPHVKDVCLTTGNHVVYTKSWSNYGVDSFWNTILEKVSNGVKGEHIHPHPCLRENQTITSGDINYIGSNDTAKKWDAYVSSCSFLLEAN